MTYSTYTEQASAIFQDNQAIAQAELNHHISTQAETVAPTQDPLTSRDCCIISEIIEVEPESIRTIWIEAGITVWVQFVDGGRLPFDRNWFATRVAQVKATLPETPRERNERLSNELEAACTKFGLTHGQVDWVSFSTTLYMNRQRIGFVGCNCEDNWYSRRNQLGRSHIVPSVETAIAALLGVRQTVAA
ncbi:hypothetical protein VB735_14690 [Halotia wernerae UHCC 0503]|nr:hypothetical protein [Halotia wernerae UHCC 0503]